MPTPSKTPPTPGQDELPLRAALSHQVFPGRTMLSLGEISRVSGLSIQHLHNLIDAGDLTALDLRTSRPPGPPDAQHKSTRRWLRVPVSAYDDLIRTRSTLR